MAGRIYRAGRRREPGRQTRAAVMAAVRDLLAEGSFQEATVEQIAERAGVSRATVYQHFRSRMGLIDAICETLDENPEFVALIGALELEDSIESLRGVLQGSVRFIASEEGLHRHLYGLAEVDPAAAEFVARQTAERRQGLEKLVGALKRQGRLRSDVADGQALATLFMITSPRTFNELRQSAHMGADEIARLFLLVAEETLLAGMRPEGLGTARAGRSL
jgi:AcrR family transcriptional regulator